MTNKFTCPNQDDDSPEDAKNILIIMWVGFGGLCVISIVGLFVWLVVTLIALPAAIVLLIRTLKERDRIYDLDFTKRSKDKLVRAAQRFKEHLNYGFIKRFFFWRNTMQKITFPCLTSSCRHLFEVPRHHVGRTLKCPDCNNFATVPTAAVADWVMRQLIGMQGDEENYVTVPPDIALADYIRIHNIDMVGGINVVRLMYRATTTNHVDVMEWIFQQGPESRAHVRKSKLEGPDLPILARRRTEKGETLMYFAAEAGHVDAMKCLKKYGAEIDVRKNDGMMPIHIAAQHGHVDAVNWLLKQDANLVNAPGERGRKPMHYAASTGQVEVMRFLNNTWNADVRAEDDDGFRPIQSAAMCTRGEASLICLVNELGVRVNEKDRDGGEPVHVAAFCDQTTNLKCLVNELGADVNARDNSGKTPLHWATKQGNIASINGLVRELGADVNAPGDRGGTPLFYAAAEDQIESMTCLYNLCRELGKELRLQLDNGVTLRRFAVAGNLTRVIQWLDEKGIQ